MAAATSVPFAGGELKVGDSVLVNPESPGGAPYIAYVKGVVPAGADGSGGSGEATLEVVWFYRPEEAVGGRKPFHGARELFLSDHADRCGAATVIRRCRVLSLREFQALPSIGPDDFFSRFTYRPGANEFAPDRVPVFCRCAQPYNPDREMAMCDGCEEWWHAECAQCARDAMRSPDWRCPDCLARGG